MDRRSALLWGGGIAVALVCLGVAFVLGMWVAPSSDGAPGGHDHAAEAQSQVWTCAMHPQIRQPEPGQCPICGMDLIPASSGASASDPDRVVLSERARELIGLRTAEVRRQQDVDASVELLGRVEPAETTRKDLTTWVGGRVDRLHLDTTGETVRRGQIVATLYSPEVYAAHQDLISARDQVEALTDGSAASRSAAQSALRAARERLSLLGVPERELETLAAADSPTRAVPIRSPFRGTVLERTVTEGAYVTTGQSLYRVADLSQVWVQLDAYERHLGRLEVGQPVAIEVESLPGQRFEGTIAFIDPTLDPATRTARVRVEVENATGRLRPGLFATARVSAPPEGLASPLVIPATAPLFTGKRSVVYVEHEQDGVRSYEPRTVRLGPRVGEHYPVVSGLTAGERVVARGAFAVDADLQIRGGPSMMMRSDDSAEEGPPPVPLTAEERAVLRPVMTAYLSVQRALAEDDLAAATEAASTLVDATELTMPARAETAWAETAEPLRQHGEHVASASDLESARGGFEALSAAVETLLARFGNPLDTPVHVAFCPMAMNSAGARWVQEGETIDNAYFGDAMRRCGEIREAVPPGDYLSPPAPEVVTGSDPHAGHDH